MPSAEGPGQERTERERPVTTSYPLLDFPALRTRVALLVEPRDAWVGLYWNFTSQAYDTGGRLDLYLCLVPFLPLKVSVGTAGPRPCDVCQYRPHSTGEGMVVAELRRDPETYGKLPGFAQNRFLCPQCADPNTWKRIDRAIYKATGRKPR